MIVIGGFAVELLERSFLDGGWGVAKCLKSVAHSLTGPLFTMDSDDAGSEEPSADAAEVKGIITAIGVSDEGIEECADEFVDSTSLSCVGETARNDARNLWNVSHSFAYTS
jgi:hypothetical protein